MEKTTDQMLENYKIEPFTLVHDILVNWWVILLAAVSAAMIAFVGVSVRWVPQYTTSTTFVVQSRNTSASYSSLGSANTMATTFQKIVESSAMQDILCTKLGVDRIDADIQTRLAVFLGCDLDVLRRLPSSALTILTDVKRTLEGALEICD